MKSIESSLCNYSDAYILVTEHIIVTRTIAGASHNPAPPPPPPPPQRKQPHAAATQVAFKNCAPFEDCRTEYSDTFVDYADFINITIPMYNWSNRVTIILIVQDVYGVLKEMR